MATSLLLGVMMLSIPTFAELNSKTGYDRLKDSLKTTAEAMTNKANNYTTDISATVKDNGKVLYSVSTKSKVDNKKNAMETTETNGDMGIEKTIYFYREGNLLISLDNRNTYHVNEYTSPTEFHVTPDNPFNKDNAADIEKIADAVMAGLKDNVIVTEGNDGNKEFSGTISENQVPALINTVSSYFFKTQVIGDKYRSESNNFPRLTNDLYIKNVTGKANVNKQGIIENVLASGTISGKEKDGTNHEITVELLMELSDYNKTAVNPPDLTGKNVVKNVVKNDVIVANASDFVGKYKNDIVLKENGKFVKIGERYVVIAHGDDKTLEGRYYEQYLGDYAKNQSPLEFTFNAELLDKNGSAKFTFTNKEGKTDTGHIYMNQIDGNINFNIPIIQMNNSEIYSGMFNRVYDK